MVFYRVKTIKGHDYWYLQHSERIGNTVKSIHVMYIGKVKPEISALQYFRKNEETIQVHMTRKHQQKKPKPQVKPSEHGAFQDWTLQEREKARQKVIREQAIHKAYLEVIQDEPAYSTLIPIPEIKQKLKQSHPEFTEQEINEMLIDLMNKRVIDMQVAYDPVKIPIERRNRGIKYSHGLLFYVRYRNQPQTTTRTES